MELCDCGNFKAAALFLFHVEFLNPGSFGKFSLYIYFGNFRALDAIFRTIHIGLSQPDLSQHSRSDELGLADRVLLWATFGSTLRILAAPPCQTCAAMSHVWRNSWNTRSAAAHREDNCAVFWAAFLFHVQFLNPGSFGKFLSYIYFWNLEPSIVFSVRSLGWLKQIALTCTEKRCCWLVTECGVRLVISTRNVFMLHSFHVYDRMMREVNETKNGFHVVWVFRGRLASELLENFLSLEVFWNC